MSLSDFTPCINENAGISPGLRRPRRSACPWCSLPPAKGEPTDTGRFHACGMRVPACHRWRDGNCKHLSWRGISGGSPAARAVPGLCCPRVSAGCCRIWGRFGLWSTGNCTGKCRAVPRSDVMPSIKATLPSSTGNSFLGSSLDVPAGHCRCS